MYSILARLPCRPLPCSPDYDILGRAYYVNHVACSVHLFLVGTLDVRKRSFVGQNTEQINVTPAFRRHYCFQIGRAPDARLLESTINNVLPVTGK